MYKQNIYVALLSTSQSTAYMGIRDKQTLLVGIELKLLKQYIHLKENCSKWKFECAQESGSKEP